MTTETRFAKIMGIGAILFLHLMAYVQYASIESLVFLCFLMLAISLRIRPLVPLSLILLFMVALPFYMPVSWWDLPSLPFLIPFLLTVLCLVPFATFRPHLRWLRLGSLDRVTILLIIFTSFFASVALLVWAEWTDNLGIGEMMVKSVAGVPRWVVFWLAIPLFAVINAFAEEVVYRGVIQDAMGRLFGEQHWLTLTLQSAAFALAHILGGFPNGKIGYVMVFVYGLMLGYLRARTRGMFAPYITHVLADLTIGYFLFYIALT